MRSTGDSVGGLAGGYCRGYLWAHGSAGWAGRESKYQGRPDPRIAAAATSAAARRDRGGMAGYGHRRPHGHRRAPPGDRLQGPAPAIGHLEDGWLDLAIDLDGVSIGRIQTFVPPGRALPPGTFELGIDLRESPQQGLRVRSARAAHGLAFRTCSGKGYRGFDRSRKCGDANCLPASRLEAAGSLTEFGREWVMYRITRREWEAWRPDTEGQRKPPRP